MSFYEFGKIDFYTGNDLNITQPNMPLRFSIGATDIISNVDTTINGSLTSQSLNILKNNDSKKNGVISYINYLFIIHLDIKDKDFLIYYVN